MALIMSFPFSHTSPCPHQGCSGSSVLPAAQDCPRRSSTCPPHTGRLSLEPNPCSQGATSLCPVENPPGRAGVGRTGGPARSRCRSLTRNLWEGKVSSAGPPILKTMCAHQEPQLRDLPPSCLVQGPGGRSHRWVTPRNPVPRSLEEHAQGRYTQLGMGSILTYCLTPAARAQCLGYDCSLFHVSAPPVGQQQTAE